MDSSRWGLVGVVMAYLFAWMKGTREFTVFFYKVYIYRLFMPLQYYPTF